MKRELGRAAVAQAYIPSMDAFTPRFEVYRKAEFLFNWPCLTNKLVKHTNQNSDARSKVEGLFNEVSDPSFLLTLSGWKRILFH